jgi:hypothetical protein
MPPESMTLLRPDPATFRTGDLVWPRADDQYVPYFTGEEGTDPVAEAMWVTQRDAFVARVASDPAASSQERELVELIEQWSYGDFLSFPGPPGEAALAARRPWVGHMGIVEVRGGVPWVIDATPSRQAGAAPHGPTGVADQPYADWLADNARGKAHVWHGRLRGLSAGQLSAITAAAQQQVGKPYVFLRLNLDDTAGFYCSKLIWWAAWKGAGISLDGPGPSRRFWFSPLQAMRSTHLEMLYVPPGRDYGLLRQS